MPLPPLENIELPLLKVIVDSGGSLTPGEAIEKVSAKYDQITPEDLASELDSGGNRWTNRVRWCRQTLYLKGELESVTRGTWTITPKGKDRVQREWESWKPRYTTYLEKKAEKKGTVEKEHANPREDLETARRALMEGVQSELLEKTKHLPFGFFESLIKRLLERIGYSNVRVTGRSHDEGIDGECSTDKLGLARVAFQAKRWQGQVPSKEVRDFVGALSIRRVPHGIFVTTGTFSAEAVSAAQKAGNVMLVDGGRLGELMVEAGLGVTNTTLNLPTIDEDFFEGTT